jgi:hypothetical protein
MINLGNWFGKKDPDGAQEGLADLRLDSMRIGDLVDYDLQTWQVTAASIYDYDGFPTQEWQLTAGDEVRFLERSEDDGKTDWTLTRSIDIGAIQEDVTGAIGENEDPPQVVHFESREYRAVESDAGMQFVVAADGSTGGSTGENAGREFVSWSYEARDEERVLFISQWGERRFTAYEGEPVNEYSFTDILPGGER